MATHTLHVTRHYTVTLTDEQLREADLRPTKANIREYAGEVAGRQELGQTGFYLTEVVLESTEEDPPAPKVRRGIGSH